MSWSDGRATSNWWIRVRAIRACEQGLGIAAPVDLLEVALIVDLLDPVQPSSASMPASVRSRIVSYP